MNSAVIPLRQSAIESSLKRAAFDALPLLSVCLNGSAQILAASRAAAALVNLDAGQLVGRHLSEVLGYRRHRDFARRWSTFWARLHESGKVVLRTLLRLADGRTIAFELVAQRLRDEHEGLAVVTLRDLSSERAERRGRRDRIALDDVLLAVADDVGVLLDVQRCIVGVRGGYERMFGDRPFWSGIAFDELLDAASCQAFIEAFEQISSCEQGGRAELLVRAASLPERELSLKLDNRLADVRVGGVVAVLRDVHETQVAVRQSDRMRKRLSAFVEHSAALTLVLDQRGIVHFVSGSARSLLGGRLPATGGVLSAMFEAECHRDLAQTLAAAIADPTRSNSHGCLVYLRAADGARHALWLMVCNLGGDAAVGGLLATATDVAGLLPEMGSIDSERHVRRLAMRERLLDLAVQSRLDFAHSLSSVLRIAGEALEPSTIAFWRSTGEQDVLHCESAYDPHQNRFIRDWVGRQLRRDHMGPLFARLADRQPLRVTDVLSDRLMTGLPDEAIWTGVGALLLVPVLLDGEIRGVLSVHHAAAYQWDDDDVAFMTTATLMTALALEGAQRVDAETQLEQLAWYDPLTGLPNRNLLRENLRDLMMTAGTRRRRIALMLIDLDRFKDVNDTLGHLVGDALIKSAAVVLKETVGEVGLVARLGGDEFVIAVREFAHRQEVALLAARVAQALHRTDLVPQVDTQVSASIGIALFPEHGREISTLLKNADAAMYQAKRDGRNQFSFFNPIRAERAAREVQLGIQLLKALQSGQEQFTVVYQPQVEMATGRVIGLEALIRWRHPTLGLLTPDHFIGVAEVSGLSDRVTRWMVNEVCGQIVAWRKAHAGFDIPVSINVAGRELGSTALPSLIRAALARYEIPPHLIVLEITERTLVSEGEVNNDVMSELATLGVGLSLDDFGTGYSTLGYLKRLPISALKIDQSFIEGIPSDNDSCAIVLAMLAVARHFKFKVIAEGIESVEQVDYLRSIGCAFAQGFFYSRALPAATILGYLEGSIASGASLEPIPGCEAKRLDAL